MKSPVSAHLLVLLGVVAVGAATARTDLRDSDPNDIRAASVYIQPVTALADDAVAVAGSKGPSPAPPPSLLAEIRYNVLDPAHTAHVVAYEPPEDGDEEEKAEKNGYRPHFVLTVGPTAGEAASNPHSTTYLGVACRGRAIDAGATRDFGPQATVVVAGAGAVPALERPVVLSPEGTPAAPVEEKSLLQRYWWLIAIAVLMVATGGGGEPPK
ncbi:cyclin-dependent protein kinase regulator pho80 [Niveomyces insectorum RCEF 264]|uniref:Cyclin-dependent protein kinase regulator pho80 n=1 Tax=Niveomyces insectorum RCEF 264 TaxID=1081102 RepID=A0A167ZS35_9HYPO|nr:cyclin-dependent protein kinase regulator pho80 [Niveomyces insectorum RCEF 264]